MAKDESGNYKVDEVKKADASVKTMADFTSPDILYKELIDSVKKYHPSTDISMIEKAYHIADDAHKGQLRKSGEPYIIHPLCVAIILADLELDKESIVAGLLHDVVEDTVMTPEEIKEEFGEEVEVIVDGVTKLTQLSYKVDKVEEQAGTAVVTTITRTAIRMPPKNSPLSVFGKSFRIHFSRKEISAPTSRTGW